MITARKHARRYRTAYAAVGVAAVVTTSIFAFSVDRGDASADTTNHPIPSLTVTVANPYEATWPVTLNASGAVAAWEEASIGTQIGGYRLTDVRVNVGDHVKKGQVLARFDRALLLAEQGQLKANADQATANRQRALALRSSGAISEQDTLQAVTQSKVADALLATNQLHLQYADVTAPDDGIISARTATLGAVVPVGQELFRMIRQGRLEWRGELNAAQLAQVRIGQAISLRLPDGSIATATVRQTSPSLDHQTRVALAYADLHPGSSARAGMYATGSIELSESPALVVPAESVIVRDGHSNVVTLASKKDTPSASLRRVTAGRRRGTEIEITQGLGLDDILVVQGAGFLNDGDVVRVVDGGTVKP